MTILVTGSRGKVGSVLVNLLSDNGFAVRAGSSEPERATVPDGVETVRLPLDDPTGFPAALAGVTSVFLYSQPAHIDSFVAAAEAAGVEHIVLMSADAVLYFGQDNAITALHLSVERALDASSITTTVLNCGALASNVMPWAWAMKATGAVPLPYPYAHADPLDERDVAECAFAALTEPETQGRSYHLTGPESLTFTEQIAILAEAAGREIPVAVVTPEVWKEGRAGYIPAPIADALLDIWAASGSPLTITDNVKELTGHPARTFHDWAREHADAFRTS